MNRLFQHRFMNLSAVVAAITFASDHAASVCPFDKYSL